MMLVDVTYSPRPGLANYGGMGLHNKASYVQDKVEEAHLLVVQPEYGYPSRLALVS